MAKVEEVSKTLECWHGVNNSPKTYPFEKLKRVLIPVNLLYDGTIPLKYPVYLKDMGVQIMLDSGAPSFYLKKGAKERYPVNYLTKYLFYVRMIQPVVAWSLDFCFEKPHLQTKAKLLENFESQLTAIKAAKAKGLVLYPVAQGWNEQSYKKSAYWVKELLESYQLDRFGIGSICRAGKERVTEVLDWVGEILPLELAHGFGLTQRTIDHRLKSVDTSNASGDSARGGVVSPRGVRWYHRLSNQGSNKHFLDLDFPTSRAFKRAIFVVNVLSLETACFLEVQEEGLSKP